MFIVRKLMGCSAEEEQPQQQQQQQEPEEVAVVPSSSGSEEVDAIAAAAAAASGSDLQPVDLANYEADDVREANSEESSVDFNDSTGFASYYQQLSSRYRNLPCDRTYTLARELYGTIDEEQRNAFRRGYVSAEQRADKQSGGTAAAAAAPACPQKKGKKFQMQDFMDNADLSRQDTGFNNFLEVFESKTQALAQNDPSAVELARVIYTGLTEAEKDNYRNKA